MRNHRLGRGAYLADGHQNAVQPRRRPLRTLNARLVTGETGRLGHGGNTPGRRPLTVDMQPLSHLIDHGLERLTISPGSDANAIRSSDEFACESWLGADAIAALCELGRAVSQLGPWDAGGSALVISADGERGLLADGADPRQDGVVLGG